MEYGPSAGDDCGRFYCSGLWALLVLPVVSGSARGRRGGGRGAGDTIGFIIDIAIGRRHSGIAMVERNWCRAGFWAIVHGAGRGKLKTIRKRAIAPESDLV